MKTHLANVFCFDPRTGGAYSSRVVLLIVKLHTRRRIRFYTNVPLKKYPHTQWPTQKFIFWVESGDIDQSPSSFLPLFFRRITQPLKSNL